MVTPLLLCAVLGQLSAPPIFPADDPPPPLPTISDAPRSAKLVPALTPASPGLLAGRAVLSPVIAFGVGVLTVPLAIYLGALVGAVVDPRQGETVGGGMGAIVGGALGFIFGTAIASSLFDRDPTAFRRALPWSIGAAALTTLGVCLVFFVPAIGVAALPWVVVSGVALAAAVPLVTELARPRTPEGVTVATF